MMTKITNGGFMKKLTFIIAALLSSTLMAVSVDPGKSKVEWLGKKVTGEHKGTIKIKSGDLEMKDGKLSGGNIVIDMTTINTTDLEGDWKKKLDGHLNSPDFFNTSEHKTASFKVTDVKSGGKDKYTVTGDLTIKGITKPVTFNVNNKKGMYKGTIKFDRTKFDVKYKSGSFFENLGDKMIYDDVELTFSLATK